MRPQTEVKGIWFASVGGYVSSTQGPESLEALVEGLRPEHRPWMLDPLPSEWYPEVFLQDMLHAAHRLLCDGDDGAFLDFIEGATTHGVGRFFRLFLGLASPRFIMRTMPSMWGRVRRGGGRAEVEVGAHRTVVSYRDFAYFDDPSYRVMSEGTLRGLCAVTGCDSVQTCILDHGVDWIDVEVRY